MHEVDENSENRVNGIYVGDGQLLPTDIQYRSRCQWVDGTRTRATVKSYAANGREQGTDRRPFVQDTDLPQQMFGSDSAPSPHEHLLSAVAACLVTTIVYLATTARIHLDAIHCDVEGDIDLRGLIGQCESDACDYDEIRVSLSIDTNVDDNEFEDLVLRSRRTSPLISLLSRSTRVVVSSARL